MTDYRRLLHETVDDGAIAVGAPGPDQHPSFRGNGGTNLARTPVRPVDVGRP